MPWASNLTRIRKPTDREAVELAFLKKDFSTIGQSLDSLISWFKDTRSFRVPTAKHVKNLRLRLGSENKRVPLHLFTHCTQWHGLWPHQAIWTISKSSLQKIKIAGVIRRQKIQHVPTAKHCYAFLNAGGSHQSTCDALADGGFAHLRSRALVSSPKPVRPCWGLHSRRSDQTHNFALSRLLHWSFENQKWNISTSTMQQFDCCIICFFMFVNACKQSKQCPGGSWPRCAPGYVLSHLPSHNDPQTQLAPLGSIDPGSYKSRKVSWIPKVWKRSQPHWESSQLFQCPCSPASHKNAHKNAPGFTPSLKTKETYEYLWLLVHPIHFFSENVSQSWVVWPHGRHVSHSYKRNMFFLSESLLQLFVQESTFNQKANSFPYLAPNCSFQDVSGRCLILWANATLTMELGFAIWP